MGFMNTTTSFVICEADGNKFDAGALRRLAFSPSIGTDNRRQGWVGLGDPLDDAFSVGLDGGSIAGFSLRVDTRKPSSAAIKIKLTEKIKEEEALGKKVSASRKKELREAITAKLTAKAECFAHTDRFSLAFGQKQTCIHSVVARFSRIHASPARFFLLCLHHR